MTVRVGIVGVSGYAGIELHRILSTHPAVEVAAVAAGRAAGDPLDASWPGVDPSGETQIAAADPDALARSCDVVFLALPHGRSAPLARALLALDRRVIDLGADFRLRTAAAWDAAYGRPHGAPELLGEAVYGLPERNREALAGARLVAVPGCYPTAVALAALPLVDAGAVDLLMASCLSGISGAGRKPGPRNLYGEVHDSAVAYGVGGTHRHSSEMEQTLGVPVAFTPHLVPMGRGMIATVTARVADDGTDWPAAYRAAAADHPAWHITDAAPATREVRGTGLCRVHVAHDRRRGVVTATSAIDNLGKGAAAQAVHCMNLALGLRPLAGVPVHPFLP